MNRPNCNYRLNNAFGSECGGKPSVQVWITRPTPNDPEFQVACTEHRGELSRQWPGNFFWEFV